MSKRRVQSYEYYCIHLARVGHRSRFETTLRFPRPVPMRSACFYKCRTPSCECPHFIAACSGPKRSDLSSSLVLRHRCLARSRRRLIII